MSNGAIVPGSLAGDLRTLEAYADSEMPHTLSPLVHNLLQIITEAYAAEGSPDGTEDRDAPLYWFDRHFMAYQQAQEMQTHQAEIEQALSELVAVGDARREADGSIIILPKAAARSLVFHLAEVVKTADDEKRDLNRDELYTMEYFVALALAAIVSYKKRQNNDE
jgi:hypothetical protein